MQLVLMYLAMNRPSAALVLQAYPFSCFYEPCSLKLTEDAVNLLPETKGFQVMPVACMHVCLT